MKKILVVCTIVFLLTSCTTQSTPDVPIQYQSEHHVYTLDVRLDQDNKSLQVEGELSYLNDIVDLNELYLQLYPNAINPTNNEWNTVFDYLTIDDEDMEVNFDGEDDTLLHFTFDEPFVQGERISIEFSYSFDYWEMDRLNAIGSDYFMTMFFYPFVPVYEDGEWNIEPYSFVGESYFNTVGDYYITIEVPQNFLVAASGKELDQTIDGSVMRYTYEIKNARDFSFSASSLYTLYTLQVEDRLYEIYSVGSLSRTTETLYFDYITTAFDMMESGVGPYDYDHFTLELGYIYGMESTGVVYCSRDVQEGTIAHEIIHQWFYSIIGSNQADEPFLDEALTTYATALYFEAKDGEEGYNGYLDFRSSLKPEAITYFNTYQGQNINRHISDYPEGYGYLVYYHGPTIYRYYIDYFLDGNLDRFKTALAAYYDAYQYQEATIDDFFTLLETVLGEPGTKEWLYEQIGSLQNLEQESP